MWDNGSGYSLSDPKNPNFHSNAAAIWDNRDKCKPTSKDVVKENTDGKESSTDKQ